MTQISKFETSFKSGNKILFAFDCHGSPGSMCGHESKHWFTFFKNIKSQTRSDLALITNACSSGNFFYKKNSPFAAIDNKNKSLFEFIITGTPLVDDEIECVSSSSTFWDEDLKNLTRITKRPEVLILAYPMFRFLTGISSDPTPAEMFQFHYDPYWMNFIPTPSFQQWKDMPKKETTLQDISKGICPQNFMCAEDEYCNYLQGFYIQNEEHETINAQKWNLLPIEFSKKKAKPEDDLVELKKINDKLEILKDMKEKNETLYTKYQQILKNVEELKKSTKIEWIIEDKTGRYKEDNKTKIGIYYFKSGDQYEGQIQYNEDKKRDDQYGIGCYTSNDGIKYLGTWENGQWNGFGIKTTTTHRYIGDWENHKMIGTFSFSLLEEQIEINFT